MKYPKSLDKLHSVVTSPCHTKVMEDTLDNILAKVGLSVDDISREPKVSVVEDGLSIYASKTFKTHNEDLYEAITTSKYASIYDTEEIVWTCAKTIIALPQHVKMHVHVSIYIPLPEEDLLELRRLGKVHTETVEASVSETVYCTL